MKKLLSLLLALLLSVSLFGCSSSEEPQEESGEKIYNIGVLQLIQHVALDAATDGFIRALDDKLPGQYRVHVQNASGDANNCNTIANQFVNENVDLIMANATPALQASASATSSIPIVGVSISHYGTALDISPWNGTTGKNITGVSDLAPLDQQAAQILEIFPDTKSVGILYCSAEANSDYQATVVEESLKALGVSVKRFTFSDSNDLAAVTQSACDESDVIYVPTDNTCASFAETINNVTLNANTPVVAGEEGICKSCGCVTISISYDTIGYQAGLMAYEILVNGADPATMEIQFAPEYTKKYNPANCEKYGITLPEDYVPID